MPRPALSIGAILAAAILTRGAGGHALDVRGRRLEQPRS
jgi:hypothetical protein